MRINAKGQVTIPTEIRERFGFSPDSEVVFEVEDDRVILRKAKETADSRGRRLVRHLRGAATMDMTIDELMTLTRGDE